MGWLGRWIWSWGGRWLGYQAEQQQLPTAPYTRYGRVLNPITDRLFSFHEGDIACESSSGAVILARQPTDDYVRMRVPDTNCPPLPQPDIPLDDGQADNAEPNRWQYGGQYVTGTGWRFGRTSGDALDWVQPSYTCYSGDFETEITLSWSDAGLPRIGGAQSADFDKFIFGLPALNSGIGLGYLGGQSANQPWDLRVFAYVSGNVGTLLGWLRAGTTATFKLKRVGTTISVQYGSNSATVATGVSGQVQLKLWRDFSGEPPYAHIPGVTVTRWETLSGAPEFISVTTPVVDMGEARRVAVRGLPSTAELVWRAGNELPLPDYWDNPVGEYRYWQAKLQTNSSATLLERMEFVADAEPLTLWRRFRSYWQLFQTGRGRVTRGAFRTVFGSGGQQRTPDGWIQQSDEERNVGDW